jgi:hypothetical protein
MNILYSLRFGTPPTWRTRFPFLYPLGSGWPSYSHRHCVPFSSPLTTRRITVEVFDPASTRLNYNSKSEPELLYDLWFTANKFILASGPLRHTTRNFFQLNSCISTGLLVLRYIAPARTTQKTFLKLLCVYSLLEKQRVHRAVLQQRLLYCRLFTQLLPGNGSRCYNTDSCPI